MAIVTPGPLISQITGSIGGTCFAPAAGGAVARNKPLPRRHSSTYAADQASRMIAAQRAWLAADDDVRLAWSRAAALYPTTNRLGKSSHISGHALFLRVYAAPPGLSISAPSHAVSSLRLEQCPLDYPTVENDGTVILTFDTAPTYPYPQIIIEAARTHSTYPTRTTPRNLSFIAFATWAPTIDISYEFIARLGTPTTDELVHLSWYTWRPYAPPSSRLYYTHATTAA